MYKVAAITIALLAVFEPSAAYEKPITLRRLHSKAKRKLHSVAPVAISTSAPVVIAAPIYIPHKVAKSSKSSSKSSGSSRSTKSGKRQLVHYQAPYEN
ncbi:unnamed protein product [Cylindrotheca closterium]|uniref:Uncharacterized protein n=1 Tax=Cylindrotheca closterium TaxID=2856 RepID=A0AAD2FZK6_9STRA|nr:unnamed protein product [Cylindrotheca closterium]